MSETPNPRQNAADADAQPIIEMAGIHKSFGRLVALNDVDFQLRENEVMGLLGDNGSGKSTLVKCLVGVHQPDAGTIRIHGQEVDVSSPKQARTYGISTVYQDLALVNELTVAANMFLARNPVRRVAGVLPVVDWDEMNERAETILRERMNLNIDPTARVEFLSGGERQAIAIARALVTDPDIVVMDEPTSALSPDSAKRVQELISTLQDEGISIVVISHNMDEVFSVCDRITVLDNGDLVGSVDTDDVTESQVVEMMVSGRMPAHLRSEGDPDATPGSSTA
ncbi:MAG: ATP-binding cassette domain-containing protein [Halobacteriaceae archaeon]